MIRIIRWLAVLLSIAVLTGCAYPSFNRNSTDLRIRTVSFDQRFPLLMAYKECILDDPDRFESCENKTYDSYYSFAHFDEASTSWTPIVSQRRYTGIAKLIPSYSFNPTIRVLDTLAATHRFRPQYRQDVFFYREASAADDHQVMVALPRATCPPIENKGEYSEETADLWQPVKFVVVVGGRATIFVELNREKADCAGLRVQDVLGDTAGIPADLAARAYRVYTADVAQAPGGKVLADLVKAPLCTVETGVADD